MKDSTIKALIVLAIIAGILFMWYRGDNVRLKQIERLNETIIDQEGKIQELKDYIKILEEESGK